MSSKTGQVASAVAAIINGLTLPVSMPARSPLAKTAVAPVVEREVISDLAVLVVYGPQRIVNPNVVIDQCGFAWNNQVLIQITRKLDDYPTDYEQPATLAAVDQCLQNAEFIAEHLAANRSEIAGLMLNDIEHSTLVSDVWLQQSQAFYSEVTASYG